MIKNDLTISSLYSDTLKKGYSLSKIPEEERTLEMCFVAIHYSGAALEFVPEKYKTHEFCLYAVRRNIPVDEGCSALAFVPEELKTWELCIEAIRHDCLPSVFWDCGHTVEWDYAAAINFVPKQFKTPVLCFEALLHHPSSMPGFFNFVDDEFDKKFVDGHFYGAFVQPKSITDITNSPDLFLKALKRLGLPDEFDEDALRYFEKIKCNVNGNDTRN